MKAPLPLPLMMPVSDVAPVPPYATEIVELAPTVPLMASRGPVSDPMYAVPEMVKAVVDAYGKTEAFVVDVAWKYGAAICLQTSRPPAMVEVPTPETRIFCVVVGVSAD